MEQSHKLTVARNYYTNPPIGIKGKRSASQTLAAFGFDDSFINGIIKFVITPKFNHKTLDALMLIAVAYEAHQRVSPHLVRLTVQNGTPLSSVSRYTAVPIEELREALA